MRVTKGAKTFIVQRRVAGKTVRVTAPWSNAVSTTGRGGVRPPPITIFVEDFVLKCAGLKESAPVVKLEVTLKSARATSWSADLDAAR